MRPVNDRDRAKARRAELATQLYNRRTTLEVQAVQELCGLLLEDIKHTLLTSSLEELRQLQGEAKAYQHLQKLLSTASPTLPSAEQA